jgi:hypothetical protein
MPSRFRSWYYLLLPLLLVPFMPALIVFLVNHQRHEGSEEPGQKPHSRFFETFKAQMKVVATKLGAGFDEGSSDTAASGNLQEQLDLSPGERSVQSVVLVFRSTDPARIDELALGIEKEISTCAGDEGAHMEPTSELWPQGHLGRFQFKYRFDDGTVGAIRGDVHIDVENSKSFVLVSIAEG